MKMPKYLLNVGGTLYAVPHNKGVAAVINLLCDAVPVSYDSSQNEITAQYLNMPHMTEVLTHVSVRRIPPGAKWKMKTKEGEVVNVQPVPKKQTALNVVRKKAPALTGGKILQLEFRP